MDDPLQNWSNFYFHSDKKLCRKNPFEFPIWILYYYYTWRLKIKRRVLIDSTTRQRLQQYVCGWPYQFINFVVVLNLSIKLTQAYTLCVFSYRKDVKQAYYQSSLFYRKIGFELTINFSSMLRFD
jgi:hypothetical protein